MAIVDFRLNEAEMLMQEAYALVEVIHSAFVLDKSVNAFDEFEPFPRLTALVDILHIVMKDLVKVKAQLQVSASLRVLDSSNDKHAFSISPSKLVEFESGFDAWAKFYDLFITQVHSRTDFSNTEKFHILKSHMKGRALASIANIPVIGFNYESALSYLQKRFSPYQANNLRSSLKADQLIIQTLCEIEEPPAMGLACEQRGAWIGCDPLHTAFSPREIPSSPEPLTQKPTSQSYVTAGAIIKTDRRTPSISHRLLADCIEVQSPLPESPKDKHYCINCLKYNSHNYFICKSEITYSFSQPNLQCIFNINNTNLNMLTLNKNFHFFRV